MTPGNHAIRVHPGLQSSMIGLTSGRALDAEPPLSQACPGRGCDKPPMHLEEDHRGAPVGASLEVKLRRRRASTQAAAP